MEVFISNTLKRYLIYEHYSFYTVYLNFKGFVTVSCVAVKAEPRDKGWTKEDCFIFGLKNAKTLAITRKLPDYKGNTELMGTTQHIYTLEGIKAEWTQLGTLLNRIRLTREGSKTEHNTNKTWEYQNKKGIDTYKHNETKIKTGELDSRTGDKPNGDMADWGDKGAKHRKINNIGT